MKILLREIRKCLKLSQTELAERLKVSFAAVNRWENGHALPNALAQAELFALCEGEGVPVYELTLGRIEEQRKACSVAGDRMLLYHASKSGIAGKIRPISRPECDFGTGFYMGDEISQALTLVCDYDDSKLYIVSLDVSKLETLKVKADLEWALLVAFHRGRMEAVKGTPFYEKYSRAFLKKDLVIGSIANDRIFYVVDNFFQGHITDIALMESLSALRLGKQYVAVTQKACDCVKIEKEIELSYLEREFIKKVAEEKRETGIKLANKICKDKRREGLFFDEILEAKKRGK